MQNNASFVIFYHIINVTKNLLFIVELKWAIVFSLRFEQDEKHPVEEKKSTGVQGEYILNQLKILDYFSG